MVDVKTLLTNLPAFEDSSVLIVDAQDTEDIMQEVYECHFLYASDYDEIYKFFDTGSIVNDCRTLFDFCKKYIPYKVESEEDQTSRSPAAILTLGNGDCKHYAQFIGGIVSAIKRNTNANFQWYYRYANYDGFSDMPGHVFIVVKSGGNEYWIDPVLNRFNQRLEPNFYIDEKIQDEMLRRVSGIGTAVDSGTETLESLRSNPEIDNILRSVDTSINVPFQLADAINVLMSYGVMNSQGEIDPELLNSLLAKNNSDINNAVFVVTRYVENNAVGNFFDDAFKAVQHVAAGMGMQVPRAAFLGIVAINGFGYATKLNTAYQYTDSREKLEDLWWRVGGSETALRSAIASGKGKKAIFAGIGCNCGGKNCVGCADGVSTVVCLVASAAIIIAAIMPVITKLIAGRTPTATTDPALDPSTGLPYGYNTNTGGINGVIAWMQQNPVIVIGGILAIAYLVTSKEKRA